MNRWNKYLKQISEESASQFGKELLGNKSLSSTQSESLSTLFNIIRKMVSGKYRIRLLEFVRRIANEDPEIKDLYDQLVNDGLSTLRSGASRLDSMMPPDADQASTSEPEF